jgi:hypothetical protein
MREKRDKREKSCAALVQTEIVVAARVPGPPLGCGAREPCARLGPCHVYQRDGRCWNIAPGEVSDAVAANTGTREWPSAIPDALGHDPVAGEPPPGCPTPRQCQRSGGCRVFRETGVCLLTAEAQA